MRLQYEYDATSQHVHLDCVALAPNNSVGNCLSKALTSEGNGVSMALDLTGVLAGFLPGGGLVTGSRSVHCRVYYSKRRNQERSGDRFRNTRWAGCPNNKICRVVSSKFG
jgi:hypothetical protein